MLYSQYDFSGKEGKIILCVSVTHIRYIPSYRIFFILSKSFRDLIQFSAASTMINSIFYDFGNLHLFPHQNIFDCG